MGLHRPFDRTFFVIGGAVKTSGGSLDLVKGQLALVDSAATTSAGAKVLSSLAGIAKDKKFLELRLGIDEREVNRSYSNKPMITMPFSLNEIVDLKVSAPKRTEQRLDEIILGYNGVDANTSFNLESGETYKRITVEVYGDAIAYLGGGRDTEIVSINFEVPTCSDVFNDCVDCDPCSAIDCKAWTENVIETFRNHQLTGGTKLGDMIEISPVLSCDNAATQTLIPYDFYTLEVCDTGDADALAAVAAQYNVPVKRVDRKGAISTYEMLIPQSAGAPADYVAEGGAYIKGCADCVAPAVEVVGGFAYSMNIEDDGADLTAAITAVVLPDATIVSVVKASGQSMGVGAYTAIYNQELSDADKAAILAASATLGTATFTFLGEVASLCQFPDEAAVAWTVGSTCNVVEEVYLITLPDNECGESRLAELQSAYKDITIAYALIADGAVADFDAVTSVGCSKTYKATVTSNLICDECDPIYLDMFTTAAPGDYDTIEWVESPVNATLEANTNCLCGIKFKAKPFILKSGECFRDRINFKEDSVRIRVSGGYPDEIREGIGKTPKEGIFAVTRVSKFEPRTHLGGNLQDFEDMDRLYFRDETVGDNLKRYLRGLESSIQDQTKQYVDYALTVNHRNSSQGFGAGISENFTYHVLVEVGKHQAVEDLLNALASAAGVGTVQAFGA